MKNKSSFIAKQQGMTLLEVLVAVLILAIGLLGVAGLQSQGQRTTAEASVRTYATVLANELLDRMRINRVQAKAGAYAFTAAPGGGVDCRATECSTADLRDFDINEWVTQVGAMLPNGKAEVVFNDAAAAVNPSRYEVRITWDLRESEQDDPTNPAGQTKTMVWVMAP